MDRTSAEQSQAGTNITGANAAKFLHGPTSSVHNLSLLSLNTPERNPSQLFFPEKERQRCHHQLSR
jgi:hypothetical protein